jgi:3-carboxy-cis,cis-muconate cycloisomerase
MTHRDTPMAGRTLTQHAVPVTFGLRAAGWLALVLDGVERVRRCRALLPVSLAGAAGTLAAYREYALATGDADGLTVRLPDVLAAKLGLAGQVGPWHGVRTPFADLASALLVATGGLGKIAADVLVLSRTEIGEVAEERVPGRGASSAMPQKHNPVVATLVATAARQLPPNALILFQSMVAEDERSSGAWHAEWQAWRECLRIAAGAADNAARLLASLSVRPEVMAANLGLTRGAIVSERLNVALAPLVGKAEAKRLLAEATAAAERDGTHLLIVLATALNGAGVPDRDAPDLSDLLDPSAYTGICGPLVDRALTRYRTVLKETA